ncbi:hypothetical protein WMY93_011945 [Mugilogobius chulae]|uniref:Glucosaminyl (N-acetyl) transferase family member 7 n=1 Tax=Mugilogobius chulae TaxID=88201 RepID=A0AAW0PE68_9GOBI
MCHLEPTKGIFVVCLGLSVMVCSLIYLSADEPAQPKPRPECRPFVPQCQPFLLGYHSGLRWHRQNCQVDQYITNNTLDCSKLISDLNFITVPLSKEEEDYPLAFILTIHKDLDLFIRLLRAIYMPQNVYCIHTDAKAPLEYQASVHKLASCFDNVFQDFPIMSNLEIVRYMQSETWKDKNMNSRDQTTGEVIGGSVRRLERKKGPPPRRMQLYFGTAYYALTREFVDFVLTSPVAQELLVWSRDTYSPDEHFWVTLNHIEDAPGSFLTGEWEGGIRAIKWSDQEGSVHDGCKGQYVRDICVYGIDDLPWLFEHDSMFANKFDSGLYPEALDCMEQWHRNKVLMQAAVAVDASWLIAIPHSNSTDL